MHAYRNHLPLSCFFFFINLAKLFYLLLWMWNNVQQNHRFFSLFMCRLITFSEPTVYIKLHNTHIFFSIRKYKTISKSCDTFQRQLLKIVNKYSGKEFFHFIEDENNIKTGDWKRFSRHNFRTSARNTNVSCSNDDKHRLNYYLIFKQNTFVIVIHFSLFLPTIYFRNGIHYTFMRHK